MSSVLALVADPPSPPPAPARRAETPAADELFGESTSLLDSLPLLLEEPNISTQVDPDTAAWYPVLLNRLLAAEWPAARRELVRTLVRDLGFDSLVFGCYVQHENRWLPRAFWTTYADMSWLQRYICASYHRVDPCTARALQCSLPCIWSIDALQRRCDENTAVLSLEQAFVDDLRRTGMSSGALVTLPSRRAGASGGHEQRHTISLASRREGCAWLDEARLGEMLMLSLCLNELYSKYLGLEIPAATAGDPAPAMTSMQRKILDCVARGLCDKKIASELGLSAHNVDYHLRQLRRRFGVHNRVQLATAAVTANLS